MEHTDIAIIGAGAVGLAVAREVSGPGRTVAVLERNSRIGQETSSRSSEVIHAGIYYPAGSLKAELCVAGAALLYEYCRDRGVRHARPGKLIVAVEQDELAGLEALQAAGLRNGAQDLELLSRAEVSRLEPEIACLAALHSPGTGILDSHQFMQTLAAEAESRGAVIVCGAGVTALDQTPNGYRIECGPDQDPLLARIVINCAGLHADRVAALAGVDDPALRLKWCKGDYFTTSRPFAVRRLIYPVETAAAPGLGIHFTRDLAGRIRFGPDAVYTDALDYAVDETQRDSFAQAARRYLPSLKPEDLMPDLAGIRPKLQGPGEAFRDFVIRHEAERGLQGFINLIGIESPGLTAALAIARRVAALAAHVG